MDIKTAARRLGLEVLHRSGAAGLAEPWTGGRGLIFMLHHVRPSAGAAFAPNAHLEVTPAFLDQTIALVKRRGLDPVPLSAVPARLADPPKDGRRFAAFTLDDGYRDNHRHAWPIFRRHGVPFTVFVTTGFVDRTATMWWKVLEAAVASAAEIDLRLPGATRHLLAGSLAEKEAAFAAAARLIGSADEDVARAAISDLARREKIDSLAITDAETMSWREVADLAGDRLATIGGHTVSHPRLAALPADRAKAEMLDGALRLERMLGVRPRTFAYPYGYRSAAGQRDFALAAELGFAVAVTTRPGTLLPRHLAAMTALPRVSLNGRFQDIDHVGVLMSGAPFALERLRAA